MVGNQLSQAFPDRDEAGRHRERLRIVDHAEMQGAKLAAAVRLENGDAGVAQGRIDRRNAHRQFLEQVAVERMEQLRVRRGGFKRRREQKRQAIAGLPFR